MAVEHYWLDASVLDLMTLSGRLFGSESAIRSWIVQIATSRIAVLPPGVLSSVSEAPFLACPVSYQLYEGVSHTGCVGRSVAWREPVSDACRVKSAESCSCVWIRSAQVGFRHVSRTTPAAGRMTLLGLPAISEEGWNQVCVSLSSPDTFTCKLLWEDWFFPFSPS